LENSNISFKELVDSHKTRVFNTAISFLQNKEDAEDVTQEVFIEVYHSLEKFKGQSSVSTWIYRIAVNKSLDHLRKKNRKKRFGFITSLFNKESGEINIDAGHFEHPGILLEKKEKAKILFAVIDELSENQKTAFILYHLEELSQKEIGEVMSLSTKAVESLIARARALLRVKLEDIYKNRGI
jgi:RNA polymerase sigma-70 factor (ECF subfamily)